MTERQDYDSPWKMILDTHLEDALHLYFPDIARDIDWRTSPRSLEQELRKISVESDVGAKRVDKLVEVRLKNGDEIWLLIHIEVQSKKSIDFENRMFVYHYRIYDQFNKHPVSTAVLLDDSRSWRPERYTHEQYGSKIQLDFRTVKLLDYSEDELLASPNPFAIVTLAQQLETKSGKSEDARYEAKFKLMRLLFQKGYDRQAIINLLKFIDWILRLPAELNQKLRGDIEAIMPKETKMYISSFEKIAEDRGRQEGRQVGLGEAHEASIFKFVGKKFGSIPNDLREAIAELNVEQLDSIIPDVYFVETIDDIWKLLS